MLCFDGSGCVYTNLFATEIDSKGLFPFIDPPCPNLSISCDALKVSEIVLTAWLADQNHRQNHAMQFWKNHAIRKKPCILHSYLCLYKYSPGVVWVGIPVQGKPALLLADINTPHVRQLRTTAAALTTR